MSELEPRLIVILAGAAIGVVFGILAERSAFCLLSGVRDQRNGTRSGKIEAYVVAALMALAAVQGLVLTGMDLSPAPLLQAVPALPAIILGGLLFGIGAALTRGCVSRLTVLSATGNLRAVIVLLVVGMVGYATMRGLLALPRTGLESLSRADALAGAIPDVIAGGDVLRMALVPSALACVIWLTLRAGGHRLRVIAGGLIGLLVAAAYAVNATVGQDPFDPQPLQGLSFIAPVAATLQYVMTFTGAEINFAITFVLGVLSGSFLSALLGRRIAGQGFESPTQTGRYVLGGALMGFGGVMAMGCTVGQGLSGVAVLAPAGFVAVGAVIAGMWIGLRIVEGGTARAPRLATA